MELNRYGAECLSTLKMFHHFAHIGKQGSENGLLCIVLYCCKNLWLQLRPVFHYTRRKRLQVTERLSHIAPIYHFLLSAFIPFTFLLLPLLVRPTLLFLCHLSDSVHFKIRPPYLSLLLLPLLFCHLNDSVLFKIRPPCLRLSQLLHTPLICLLSDFRLHFTFLLLLLLL